MTDRPSVSARPPFGLCPLGELLVLTGYLLLFVGACVGAVLHGDAEHLLEVAGYGLAAGVIAVKVYKVHRRRCRHKQVADQRRAG